MSETTLWTNASPTADLAAGNLTLSSGISNFDVIRIYFKGNKSATTEYYYDYPKAAVTLWTQVLSTYNPGGVVGMYTRNSSSGLTYVRNVMYTDNTTLKISVAYRTDVGTGTSYNQYIILTKICGCK